MAINLIKLWQHDIATIGTLHIRHLAKPDQSYYDTDNVQHRIACRGCSYAENYEYHTVTSWSKQYQSSENRYKLSGYCTTCGETAIHYHYLNGDEDCLYCNEPITCSHSEYDYTVVSTVSPTCTTSGYQIRRCSDCGANYTVTLQKLGHIDENNDNYCDRTGCGVYLGGHTCEFTYVKTVDPTCTTKGYELWKCSCGEEEKRNYTDTIDHIYDQEIAKYTYRAEKATCKTPAKYYYSCSCGQAGTETFSYGNVDPTTHESTGYDIAINPSANNCRTYKCCGAPLSHNIASQSDKVYKAATCTTPALYYQECIYCGYNPEDPEEVCTDKFNRLDSTNHTTPIYGGTADCHTKCEGCGATLSGAAAHSFNLTDGVKTAATCNTPVIYYAKCACGYRSPNATISGNEDSYDPTNHGNNPTVYSLSLSDGCLICAGCGASMTEHSLKYTAKANNTHRKRCTKCDTYVTETCSTSKGWQQSMEGCIKVCDYCGQTIAQKDHIFRSDGKPCMTCGYTKGSYM